jgi:hypothetical protein
LKYHTYCHPDSETDEGKDGQLKDEVDVDHDSYGWHKGQSWGHEQQSLPAKIHKEEELLVWQLGRKNEMN